MADPLHKEGAVQTPSMQPALSTAASPGRLLVVDDEENILRSLRRVLRHGDWEIRTALDAERGLQELSSFTPEVVLSDFRLPGMNGAEFLALVKERMPRAQRILLTGHADQRAIEEAINRSEIFRYVAKPWNDSQLLLTVQSAFEQFAVVAENERLSEITRKQNDELRVLNADLEERVEQRTRLLMVAKREWELSFDSLDLPLAVVRGTDYVVRRANVAYARVGGQRVQSVSQGPTCHQFLFGRDAPCPGCPLQTALASGEEGQAEIPHKGRTYVLNVYPMAEAGQAVCAYRDVTEEREMTRRLVESEKMAAVGQLAGGVAHEINNPLGGILAFSQLMKRDAGRTPADQESLQLIEESALRCKRIVESLLQFSRRPRSEDRRTFDLSSCVDDACFLFRGQLKQAPSATLDLHIERELPQVFGDPAQLGQVVLNLLQNGLHALSGGNGTLSVSTGRRDTAVYFSVTDSGTGIAADVLPRIFEPSFTTKPPGQGTGLGLAIAYRIVEDHGGTFEVKTEPKKGSTFTVLLPIPLTSLSPRN
jgi:two-component system, NtrC family, sensor kinase